MKTLTNQEQYEACLSKTTSYKTHIFKSIGNGKMLKNTAQCGRSVFANDRGVYIVNSKEFRFAINSDYEICQNCLKWFKENKTI